MSIHALAAIATEATEQAESPEISPYIFGGTALVVLLLLLFLVTRMNINR